MLPAGLFESKVRINRYIVGCKLRQKYDKFLWGNRINRYIVGCKYEDAVNYMKTGQRINRYIVGCK